jgi:3-oxoacid CoA-transferase subunit B
MSTCIAPNAIANHTQVALKSPFTGKTGGWVSALPYEGEEDADPFNAGRRLAAAVLQLFWQRDSFAMIRGGHIDLTVLGAMEVAQTLQLDDPGKDDHSMGGAMDYLLPVSKSSWSRTIAPKMVVRNLSRMYAAANWR